MNLRRENVVMRFLLCSDDRLFCGSLLSRGPVPRPISIIAQLKAFRPRREQAAAAALGSLGQAAPARVPGEASRIEKQRAGPFPGPAQQTTAMTCVHAF